MSEIEDDYTDHDASTSISRPAELSGVPMAAASHHSLPLSLLPRANPDDPITTPPPQGKHGPLPGPRFLGAPGRVAIVQAQIFIVGLILIAQLWLVTTALFDLLSGRRDPLWLLTLVSGIGFAIVLVVTFLPLRRVRGF